MSIRTKAVAFVALAGVLTVAPAAASLHLMQIHQAIGGICGNTTYQAIQLRMRSAFQTQVAGATLVVADAAGNNPITVATFPSNVSTTAAGSTILAMSTALATATGITPDAVMSQQIPEAYLHAGRLRFQSGATVFWAVAWGGTDYTGTNGGTFDNDADGNFNPPFARGLPFGNPRSLLFPGTFGDMSTNNAANYALSTGVATFTNNAGTSVTLNDPDLPSCVFVDGFVSGGTRNWSENNP